jgi:hypothetical protein
MIANRTGPIKWASRRLWALILWSMRTRSARMAQSRFLGFVPGPMRERLWASHVRQNRFARRYGKQMIAFSLRLLVLSAGFTLLYALAVELLVRGYLVSPNSDWYADQSPR